MTRNNERGPKGFRRLLVYTQRFCFYAGFFFCATAISLKLHEDFAWAESMSSLASLILMRAYARKMTRVAVQDIITYRQREVPAECVAAADRPASSGEVRI